MLRICNDCQEITDKLADIVIKPKSENTNNIEISKLKADIINIENSIDVLVDRLTESDATAAVYINQKIKKLDSEKNELLQQISRLEESENKLPDLKALTNVMSVWDRLSFDEKRDVVQLIIEKVTVYPDKIEIIWKF